MSEGLTKKEKGFVEDYIETGNATEAALNNYDTEDENVAASIGSQNLRKLKIQTAINSIAESIPDSDLIRVHLEGLQAGKKIFKNNNESGEIELVSEEPDHAVRHKYLDSAYKLKGTYAPEKKEIIGSLSLEPSEREIELAKQLNELRRSNTTRSIESNGDNPLALGGEVQNT